MNNLTRKDVKEGNKRTRQQGSFKTAKGITLIALVITIIILLILAAVAIGTLTGDNGLIKRAQDARLVNEKAKIEEMGQLILSEQYIDNYGIINDETSKTAVITELEKNGYEVENKSATSTTVKGLLIQDTSGNKIDEVNVVQGNTKTIKIALDTQGSTTTNTYVKIQDQYYELTVIEGKVKISEEAFKEVPDAGQSYEIKLTPPTSGIEIYVLGQKITQEQTITPETVLEIRTLNNTGTYNFTVKETKNTITKSVSVKVTTNPEYATGLTIGTLNNASTTIKKGEKLKLKAKLTPSTATDDVIWSIESGNATVDATGEVTANGAGTVIVVAKVSRKDGTETTVGEQKITITVEVGVSVGDIADATSKVGYYAKIGNEYGVIFADLAVGGSGDWNPTNDSWVTSNNTGAYTIPKKEGLKSYVISEESHTETGYGTHPVLKAADRTTGNDRFYVMSLSDLMNTGTYYSWYSKAYDKGIRDYSTVTSQDFGTGKTNTSTMISKWDSTAYGAQNADSKYKDMWGEIKTQVANGWFVPSRAEWAAFGAAFDITSSTRNTFGLGTVYWSSSLNSSNAACCARFLFGYLNYYIISREGCVRLATTF